MWQKLLSILSVGFLAAFACAADRPELTRISPPGGGIGSTIDVEAIGKFPRWPLNVWSDSKELEWKCLKDSGKLQVKIGANAKPGLHWVRFFDSAGASSSRPFLVGAFPEIVEIEPNNSPAEATRVEGIPHSVHGVLNKRADVDLFAVTLKANQLLAATIDAVKWLQSPADITLQVLDRNGFVLAENLDHVGLDPYLEFRPKSDGTYFVRVFAFPATPDSTIAFSGGADWCYRLQLESKPVPFNRTMDFSHGNEFDSERVQFESHNHDRLENALQTQLPLRLRSTISTAKKSDFIRFTAAQGKSYRIKIMAREFGSSMDPVVTVLDSNHKQVVQQDDVGNERDPVTIFKAATNGDFFVEVTDFHRLGGDRYAYVMDIDEYVPQYKFSVATDVINAVVGKEMELAISVDRDNEFKETIAISLETLPDGVEWVAVESKHGTDSSKKITAKIKASKPFQGPIDLIARSAESNVQKKLSQLLGKTIWLSVTPE